MQAIQIALRMVAGAGDEVIVPTPAWPNIAAAIGVGGRDRQVEVPMRFGNRAAGRSTSTASSPPPARGRAPSSSIRPPIRPAGRRASTSLRAILAFARERGLWIVADEVYHRFYYAGPRSPSFYDVAEDDDRLLYVNTFSKNWAMTGWRIGWLSAPPALGQVIENLVQYSTSGVAAFMQRGAVVALDEGEDFVRLQVERARDGPRYRLLRARRRPAASASPSRPAPSTSSSPSTASRTRGSSG